MTDWPTIEREAWRTGPERPPWPNPSARDEFERLYLQAGLSLRQVAEVTGFSREWVRRILREEGVELRRVSAPGLRAALRRDGAGRVMFTYEVRGRADGPALWTSSLYAMPSHVAVLAEFEVATPTVAAALGGGGRTISADDCAAIEGVVGGATDLTLGAAYERATRDVWRLSEADLVMRVGQMRGLLAALGRGAAGDGVVVV